MKIVFIGAGSRSFGSKMIIDALGCRELAGRNATLVLVDDVPETLERAVLFAEKIKAATGTDVVLESTTDRRKALPGADYVVAAVARKRMELWEQDFRIPVAYGFRHNMGENGGPGALFHALRSFELTLPICRDMEELCPKALFFNFTNPEARVLHALTRLTSIKGYGFCHGVFSALELIERLLKRPIDTLEIVSAGINHFYCILKVRDRETGRDLFNDLMERLQADQSPSIPPLFRKMAEVFGVFTFPSDDHISEYLSYGTEYSGMRWHFGQEGRRVTLKEIPPSHPSMEDIVSGKHPIDESILRPSGELAVPVIADILLDRKSWRPAVNVMNTGKYIENLPATGVVEVPAIVGAAGIQPQQVGIIPETFAAYMRTQFTIHELLTEAYRSRSKKLLLQALLLDPVVNSISAAEKMLDEMLDFQSEFLPAFT